MIFEVKSPILGFENVTRMELEKIDDLFMRLKNTDGAAPTFTLANPFLLREYDFEVPNAMRLALNISEKTNFLVANIMVIQNPIQNSTINFLAPVIFNFDDKVMGQIVLDSIKYPHFQLAEPIKNYYKES